MKKEGKVRVRYGWNEEVKKYCLMEYKKGEWVYKIPLVELVDYYVDDGYGYGEEYDEYDYDGYDDDEED
jgi:hypothetical protein